MDDVRWKKFARRRRGLRNAQALVVGKIIGCHCEESVRSYAMPSPRFCFQHELLHDHRELSRVVLAADAIIEAIA